MHDLFRTTDIILAAVLKLKGYDLIDIERVGSKGTFVFSSVNDEDVKEFDLGKSSVEPVNFNNTIKQLTTSVRRMG